jgi:hypothetical protein
MAEPEVKTTKVYLTVHELFGVLQTRHGIKLLPPVVPPAQCGNNHDGKEHEHKHEYKIARFKEGAWGPYEPMLKDKTYTLHGVQKRSCVATDVPCHQQFSPHPHGAFTQSQKKPYCAWHLPFPKRIHQLRIVPIRDADRPYLTGDPQGDTLDAQMLGVSIAQAFEYDADPKKSVGIYYDQTEVKLDYDADETNDPHTINLHLWAQLENEHGMDDDCTRKHAAAATKAMVGLFSPKMHIEGTHSLSINDFYEMQPQMPQGIRFIELVTLAERFALKRTDSDPDFFCTGKTCGHGGNMFVQGK